MCASRFIGSFVWKDTLELLGSGGGGVWSLRIPGGGNKMHSVFEGLFTVTMCISRQNRVKWWKRRMIPFSMSVLF